MRKGRGRADHHMMKSAVGGEWNSLGYCYRKEIGTKLDEERAFSWCSEPAKM